MRYILIYMFLGIFLVVAEIFTANIFNGMNFSIIASFVLAFSFIAAEQSKRPFRDALPVILLGAFLLDGLASLPTGVIFTSLLSVALITTHLNSNIPSAKQGDWRIMILIIFLLFFITRTLLSFYFNDLQWMSALKNILQNIIDSFAVSICGLVFYVLMNHPSFKIIINTYFNEDA